MQSIGKMTLTDFWDFQGIIHTEFLEAGNTINSEKYVETLKTLRARLGRINPQLQPILQHDNARPHTSERTQNALRQLGFNEELPHPPYSPDLASIID